MAKPLISEDPSDLLPIWRDPPALLAIPKLAGDSFANRLETRTSVTLVLQAVRPARRCVAARIVTHRNSERSGHLLSIYFRMMARSLAPELTSLYC